MIFGHIQQVHKVQALSDDVALRQLRVRQEVSSFGQHLHQRFGCVGLLLGGFSAGVLFDRLRPHWRTIHSGGSLGLSLLHLLPLVEFFGRTFWRGDDIGLD